MAMTPKEMAAKAGKTKAETEQPVEEPKQDDQNKPADEPVKDEPVKEPEQPTDEPKQDAKAADPAEIAEYCAKNGAPQLAASLIRDKATMDQVKVKVGAAGQIRDRVKAAIGAGLTLDPKFEESAISSGMTPEAVGDTLMKQLVAQQSGEVRGNLSAGNMTRAGADQAASWDAAMSKAGVRTKAKSK